MVTSHMHAMRTTCCSGLTVLLLLAVLLAPAAAPAPAVAGASLDYSFCDALSDGQARAQCLAYINAEDAMTRWTAAVRWARYYRGSYTCANVTALCLMADMHAGRYGSSCTPAPSNSACEMDTGSPGLCWLGACVDASQAAVYMLLAKDGFLRPLPQLQLQQQQQPPGTEIPVQHQQQQQQQQQQEPQQEQQQSRQRLAAQEAMQAPTPLLPTGASSGVDGVQQGSSSSSSSSASQGQAGSAAGAAPAGQQRRQQQQQGDSAFQLDPADPYGLSIDLGSSPKISAPFAPPAPPRPPAASPAAAPPPPPPVTRGRLTLDVQPDAFVQAVPPSFIGVSREWTPAVWWDKNLEAFGRVLSELGPAPILRIGGATQEGLIRAPNSTFIEGLLRLHCYLGVRFIIGLPLFQNAPQLPLAIKAAFDAAFRDYPYAVLSYELGNEPNFWPTRAGGFTQVAGATTCTQIAANNPAYQLVGTMDVPADRRNEGYAVYRDTPEPYLPYKPQSYCFTPQTTIFAAGLENYNTYFQRAANALTGCAGLQQDAQAAWGWPYWGPPGFNRRVLSGPAWGDFSMDFNTFRTFLQNSGQCYLAEATMHYYGPNRNTTFEELFNRLTALNLAANPPKTLISTVREFIQEARRSNITLRVSEANSVPDGGQAGLSNTLGAALWTLVTALEFAQAGASGINYHWGGGGSPGGPDTAPAYVGVQTGFRSGTQQPYPLVRVPYYGYVLFARAFGNNGPGVFLNFSSDAVVSECRELFFTYAILVPHAGMVSVVAVSANPNITCDVTATLPGVATAAATLQLLVGHPPGDMSTYEGVTLAGQTYQGQEDGRMRGTFLPQRIQPQQRDIRTTGWTFTVPPASAALLQIPLIGGANYGVGRATQTPDLAGGQGMQEAVDPSSAAWEPPVAVPFPPLPAFDAPPAGAAAQGGAAGGAAGGDAALPAGAADPRGVGAAPAGASSQPGVNGGAGGLQLQPPSMLPGATGPPGTAAAPVGAAGAPRAPSSGLFAVQQPSSPGAPAGTAQQQQLVLEQWQQQQQQQQLMQAQPQQGRVQAWQLPATGHYQLKGYSQDGRPIYAWSAAPQGSAGNAQQQQAVQQQQQQQQQPAAVASAQAGTLAGWLAGGQQRRRVLLGWLPTFKKPAGLLGGLGSGLFGGGSRSSSSSSFGDSSSSLASYGSNAVTYATPTQLAAAPTTAASNTRGRTYAAPGSMLAGGVGGLAGGQVLGSGSGGTVSMGSGSASRDVAVNVDVRMPGAAGGPQQAQQQQQQQVPVPPPYQNPNLNWAPGPAALPVSPRTRPAPQSAAAQQAAPGPLGVGRVWPAPVNTSLLDVGVFGMGGYTLYPPGFDADAVDRAAAQCPGIARIRDIQARAGVGPSAGGA